MPGRAQLGQRSAGCRNRRSGVGAGTGGRGCGRFPGRAGSWGGDQAGADDVGADAARGVVRSDGARQADDRAFAGGVGVGGKVVVAAYQAEHGRDVDDGALSPAPAYVATRICSSRRDCPG
jgi:hypothetical protein